MWTSAFVIVASSPRRAHAPMAKSTRIASMWVPPCSRSTHGIGNRSRLGTGMTNSLRMPLRWQAHTGTANSPKGCCSKTDAETPMSDSPTRIGRPSGAFSKPHAVCRISNRTSNISITSNSAARQSPISPNRRGTCACSSSASSRPTSPICHTDG